MLATAAARAEGFEDDKIYKGSSNYVDYRSGVREGALDREREGRRRARPMRASANVRMTFIMDYKPDICKDYKETGYCGYGDSLPEFLHDRGDYKHGWQLDREWEEKEKARKEALAKLEQMEAGLGEDGEAQGEEADDEDDAMPLGVSDRRENWWEGAKDPVVTRCKHPLLRALRPAPQREGEALLHVPEADRGDVQPQGRTSRRG